MSALLSGEEVEASSYRPRLYLPLFGREESQRIENCRSLYVRVGNRRDHQLPVDYFDNNPKSRCLTFRSLEDIRLHASPFCPGVTRQLAWLFDLLPLATL